MAARSSGVHCWTIAMNSVAEGILISDDYGRVERQRGCDYVGNHDYPVGRPVSSIFFTG